MAKTSRSLASRAGSVARRVVGRGTSDASGSAAKKTAKKAPAKKAPAAAKKAAVKKGPAKKAPAKKAPAAAKKAAVKKGPVKKATAKKAPAKAPAKKAATKSAETTQAAPVRKAAPAKKAPTTKAPPKPAATKAAPAKPKARKGSPGALVVLPGESPWTKDELAEVRTHLRADVKRLSAELEVAEGELHDLMRDAGDGAGQDQADVGSTTFERDQEMVITNNAREMLIQSQHALKRITDGTFGVCESCREPIGKMRLMAFPRATLCMTCKQREERR